MKNRSFLPRLKEKSIARNLTLSLVFIIVLVISILLTVQYFSRMWTMRQDMETKADDHILKLVKILSVPLWTFDTSAIEGIGAAFAQNERFNQIRVFNHRGEVVFQYRKAQNARQTITREKDIYHNHNKIGRVSIVLSLDRDHRALNQFLMLAILVVIGVVLIIVVVTGALLRHFISEPIESLQSRMDQVAKGDFSNHLEDIQYIELKAIARRFRVMTAEIGKREDALKQMNQELVQEIAARRQSEAERQKLEQKLIRAEKMEAIGQLAGRVAHDLNNVLSGIVSYPDLLLLKLPDDSAMRKPLVTMQQAGKRAADIVQDLLTLARRGIQKKTIINLNDIINAYLQSPEWIELSATQPHVKMTTELDPGLMNLNGVRHQLEKTVMNLVLNSVESIQPNGPHGDNIIIKTFNQYIEQPIQGHETMTEGEYAVLQIADQGVGIASEDINKIFEPFYTRKVMGRSGTGLGLAVVWSAVQDHDGYIRVASVQNEGAVFTLHFPVTRKAVESVRASESLESYTGSGETILVVDDVDNQREIASKILKRLGYRVACAASGEEAVSYLQENRVDLLMLDMIMEPGMDGLETYEQIQKLYPRQKALLASGFAATERVKKAQQLGAGAYLQKPYTMEKLGAAVKTALIR